MMHRRFFLLLVASGTAACGGGDAPPDQTAAPAADQSEVIEIADVGFATPESILHDTVADVYLVSNINGAPAGKDGDGFISRLSPEGQVEQLKWIDGAAENVTLHAPKGLVMKGDTLYVADIDCVRLFVRTTGAPAGETCFPGATFLNGLGIDGNGALYVTDSGLNPDFSPSGTDALWRFTPDGETSKVQQGDSLGRPNGVAFSGGDGFVVTFGSGEIYRFGPDYRRRTVLPGAEGRQLDGIVFTRDGGYLFSSWGDRAVHRVDAEGATSRLVEDVESPADIGYDARRNRVLVPLFTPNKVVIKQIPSATPAGG